MNGTNALAATLTSAALSLWALPALVLAQAQPGAEPAPTTNTGARAGSAGWLWVLAAIVVIAIVWWALSARRRREAPR